MTRARTTIKVVRRFLAVVCIAAPAIAIGAPFQTGTATIEITPPVGYRMSGYFYERLSKGTHDPLLAKAIVFSQGDVTAALVICDVIGIDPRTADESRRLISQACGMSANNVSIAATHSHTGPLYWGALRDQFHKAAIASKGSDLHEQFDYPAFLTTQLVAVVGEAKKHLQEVNIFAGYGHETRIAFNRRFLMKNGQVKTWIGLQHPDVVRAAGPIDPEIGLIRFESLVAKLPVSLISCYALHLDTRGGQLYSADFPLYLQQELSKEYGENFTSLFGIGTCGDINHFDTEAEEQRKTNEIGTMLAGSVLLAMPKLEAVAKPSLAVKQTVVHVPKQEYSAERITQAINDKAHVGDRSVLYRDRVEAYKILALQAYREESIPLELHAFRLSHDVAIVTLPGEVFVEFGLQIKVHSPFKTTLVIELANDAPGYIPTKNAFVEGGYETVNSRVAPGGGEKMVEAAIDMLKELHEQQ